MGQPGRIQPVGVDGHHDQVGRHTFQGGLHASTAAPHIVGVHRLGENHIGVGVEPGRERVRMMVQIALHCIAPTPAQRLLVTLGRATEARVELGLAAIGHMRDPAGQTQSEVGTPRTAVVISTGEVGVLTDGEQLRLAPGDLLG